MWQALRTIVAIVFTLLAMNMANLGMAWCDVGYGLHPALAFPLATILAAAVLVLLLVIFAEGEDIQFNNAFEAIAGLLHK